MLKLKVLDKPSVEVKDEGVFFRVNERMVGANAVVPTVKPEETAAPEETVAPEKTTAPEATPAA